MKSSQINQELSVDRLKSLGAFSPKPQTQPKSLSNSKKRNIATYNQESQNTKSNIFSSPAIPRIPLSNCPQNITQDTQKPTFNIQLYHFNFERQEKENYQIQGQMVNSKIEGKDQEFNHFIGKYRSVQQKGKPLKANHNINCENHSSSNIFLMSSNSPNQQTTSQLPTQKKTPSAAKESARTDKKMPLFQNNKLKNNSSPKIKDLIKKDSSRGSIQRPENDPSEIQIIKFKNIFLSQEEKSKSPDVKVYDEKQKENCINIGNKSEKPRGQSAKQFKDTKNYSEEYNEYKKLQEKLNYLENKIMNIKSNINQKQKGKPSEGERDKERISSTSASSLHDLKKLEFLNSQKQTPSNAQLSINSQQLLQQYKYFSSSNQQNIQSQPAPLQSVQESSRRTLNSNTNQSDQLLQNMPRSSTQSPNLANFVTQVAPAKPQGFASFTPKQTKNTTNNHKKANTINAKQESRNSSLHSKQKESLNSPKSQQTINQKGFAFDNFVKKQNQQENVSSPSLKEQLNLPKNNYYYVSQILRGYLNPNEKAYMFQLARDHIIQSMQAISFVKMLKPPNQKVLEQKRIFFPPLQSNKKTLIFDLDETLIHCNESAQIPSDIILPIKFPSGEQIEAGINIRSYAREILQEMSKYYEIIVFTASHGCYANVVLDYLDPNKNLIQGRLFRENCVQTEEGVYIKDLSVIGNRNLKDLILIDNAAYSFGYQLDNGIPILPFYDFEGDEELKNLIPLLKQIHNVPDVRLALRNTFQMDSYSEFSDPFELVQNLYSDFL